MSLFSMMWFHVFLAGHASCWPLTWCHTLGPDMSQTSTCLLFTTAPVVIIFFLCTIQAILKACVRFCCALRQHTSHCCSHIQSNPLHTWNLIDNAMRANGKMNHLLSVWECTVWECIYFVKNFVSTARSFNFLKGQCKHESVAIGFRRLLDALGVNLTCISIDRLPLNLITPLHPKHREAVRIISRVQGRYWCTSASTFSVWTARLWVSVVCRVPSRKRSV